MSEKKEAKLTSVKMVKLAVSIPGTTTQTLSAERYSLQYDSEKQVLYVQKKPSERGDGKEKCEKYVIFASNVAYLML